MRDRPAIDADGAAGLLLGLELLIQALLFVDDFRQGTGEPLELLLVGLVLATYGLGQEALDPVVVAGFLGDGLMYCGDDFP